MGTGDASGALFTVSKDKGTSLPLTPAQVYSNQTSEVTWLLRVMRAYREAGPAEKLTLKLRSISLSDQAEQPPHVPQGLYTHLPNAH